MNVIVHHDVISRGRFAMRANAKIRPIVRSVGEASIVGATTKKVPHKKVGHQRPNPTPRFFPPGKARVYGYLQAKTWKPNFWSNVNMATQINHYGMNKNFGERLENELELGYPENCQQYGDAATGTNAFLEMGYPEEEEPPLEIQMRESRKNELDIKGVKLVQINPLKELIVHGQIADFSVNAMLDTVAIPTLIKETIAKNF